MTDYLELTAGGGIVSIVIIFLLLIAAIWFIFMKARRIRKPTPDAEPTAPQKDSERLREAIDEFRHSLEAEAKQPKTKKESILNTGQFKCVAIRPNQILDFTTIPESIGEVYQADTSNQMSGGLYIVRELENGEVIDYDPREEPLVIGETPEDAWRAIDWRSCKRFWSVPISAWKTPATWFAVALVIVVFIWGLAVTGG